MSEHVEHVRTEAWVRDGRTVMVDVGQNESGLPVVVVSLELLRQMLSDLGYTMTGHHEDALPATNPEEHA